MNLNEESRTRIGVAVMIAISMSIIAILGYSLAKDRTVTYDCSKKKHDLEVIASIANATGKLPDGRTLATGEKATVNPDMCKVTFTKPESVQLNAKRVQGTDSDLQTTLNPQK